MTAALDLPTLGRSLYSELLLNQNGPNRRPFNLAPFPPVHRNQLDCGTIFTFTERQDGTNGIRTFHIPMPGEVQLDSQAQPLDVLQGGEVNLSQAEHGRIRYRAAANCAAAILIFSTPYCQRHKLANGSIDAYPEWRSQAQALFSQGYREIYHVREVWTTNRWAADLRTQQTANDAEYSATTIPPGQQFAGYIAPDFVFDHNSDSGYVRHALDPGLPEYTILALYERVQQKGLGRYAPWVVPFMQKLRAVPGKFVKRLQPKRQTQSYPSFSYSDSYDDPINDSMYKLPLGGTFSLVEIVSGEDQSCSYSLESEGHRKDFSFDTFGASLQQRFGVSDWREALQHLFPPQGQLPVTHLPPEFDFRRHGRSYSTPSTLAQRPVFPLSRAETMPVGAFPSIGAPYALARPEFPQSPFGMTRSSSIAGRAPAVGYTMVNGYASPPSSIGSPMYASPPGSPMGTVTPVYTPQPGVSYVDSNLGAQAQYPTAVSPYQPRNAITCGPGGNVSYGIATVQAVPDGTGYTGTMSRPFFSAPPGWA